MTLSLIHLILFVFFTAFYVADFNRRAHARNTEGRYYWASVCRATQYLCLACPAVGLVKHVGDGFSFLAALDLITLVLVYRQIRLFRADDDEDFWSKMKKSLRRKAREVGRAVSRALTPRPALVPIPTR